MTLNIMKSNKIILGFIGYIASGKGTACAYLKDKHNAQIFRFSSILRDVLDRFYLLQSRENLQNISTALRQVFGEDLLAQTIAKDVEKSTANIVALDGVRRLADIKYLKDNPNFHLIEIVADQKIRYERLLKRSENSDDRAKTFNEFQKDELKETEQQIKVVAKTAEFQINNNGSFENLYQQIEKILKKINK